MTIEINAETRTDLGKGASRRLRHQEKLPAIVYGSGEPLSLTIDQREMRPQVNNEVFYSSIVSLKIDGKKAEKVIVRDIQHHPFKVDVMHVDFQRIDAKKKMHIHVPLHFIGEDVAPGVKAGGLVSHVVNEVEIECLPKDIPEFIEVDLSEMHVGDVVHLLDLKLPEGVEVLELQQGEAHEAAVVTMHVRKVVEEIEDVAPEAPVSEEDEAAEEGGDSE